MAFFGGMDPNRMQDLGHAQEIERRARDAEHRRDPQQAQHRAEADGMGAGGRILWGRLVVNALGIAIAIGLVVFLLSLVRA